MATLTVTRPEAAEHHPYYGKYIALVTEDDVLRGLESQMTEAQALLRSIPEAKAEHRYAPDKWTIKEVVGHVIDAERVFAYRALRFAHQDPTPLPGFDENVYVPAGAFGRFQLSDLASEWELVRRSNLALFRRFDGEMWRRMGTAADNPISVRALVFIIAGHGRHHMAILRERYLA